MKKSLSNSLPFAEAITKLLNPFAEVVIHDLEKDCIEAIFNPLSRREVGDNSYLERIDFNSKSSTIGPYEKINWDGRKLKCISIVIKNKNNKPEGFLCINLDISHFQNFNNILGEFLSLNSKMTEKEEELFKDDLYEKINLYVQQYCKKNNTSLSALKKEDKKELVLQLEKDGAFNSKNAANYVGRVIGVSRATVYNYLK